MGRTCRSNCSLPIESKMPPCLPSKRAQKRAPRGTIHICPGCVSASNCFSAISHATRTGSLWARKRTCVGNSRFGYSPACGITYFSKTTPPPKETLLDRTAGRGALGTHWLLWNASILGRDRTVMRLSPAGALWVSSPRTSPSPLGCPFKPPDLFLQIEIDFAWKAEQNLSESSIHAREGFRGSKREPKPEPKPEPMRAIGLILLVLG